jgi:enoyl-[acyl-carrier protein] reductase I
MEGSARTAIVQVPAAAVSAADVLRVSHGAPDASADVEARDRAFDPVPHFRVMTDFTDKFGLIVGVANKRSLSWAIAQATASRGARLALTYQGRFEEHVNELSQGLAHPPLVLPCDVASDEDITSVFARIEEDFGALDFVVHGAAFAAREELSCPFAQTTREGFRVALDISAYSLIALTRGALPLMERRGGGSVLTLSYLGSKRVFPNYNVMGVAKAALEATVRYLAADVGPRNIRVNAISAGPVKTLAAAGISGFSNILNVYRDRAPLRRNIEAAEVGEAAAFLLSDAAHGITGEVVMVDAGFHTTGM